jgi:hypothetical protein
MATNKRTKKKYRPLDPLQTKLRHQPWKVAAVINPLLAIVDQLEQQGTIDVAGNGVAVFKDHCDGVWYESSVAILGVVGAYEIYEVRKDLNLCLAPLTKLANQLKYDMPITQQVTEDARACIERIRIATLDMTAGEGQQLIKDFQIKEAIQERVAA